MGLAVPLEDLGWKIQKNQLISIDGHTFRKPFFPNWWHSEKQSKLSIPIWADSLGWNPQDIQEKRRGNWFLWKKKKEKVWHVECYRYIVSIVMLMTRRFLVATYEHFLLYNTERWSKMKTQLCRILWVFFNVETNSDFCSTISKTNQM